MTRIVIVDDDPSVREVFKLVFTPEKYEVNVYSNGTVIFEDRYPLPDLFILDKQLSGIDGLDICRFLKEKEVTKNIPVIILSASPYIKKSAQDAGADYILEKPFSVKELRDVVNRYAKV